MNETLVVISIIIIHAPNTCLVARQEKAMHARVDTFGWPIRGELRMLLNEEGGRGEPKWKRVSCNTKTLPGYLKGDFIERVARLQRGALKEPAWAPVDPVAGMHRSGCRLRLVRTIGPTLATPIRFSLMSLFPYLLRLTA